MDEDGLNLFRATLTNALEDSFGSEILSIRLSRQKEFRQLVMDLHNKVAEPNKLKNFVASLFQDVALYINSHNTIDPDYIELNLHLGDAIILLDPSSGIGQQIINVSTIVLLFVLFILNDID